MLILKILLWQFLKKIIVRYISYCFTYFGSLEIFSQLTYFNFIEIFKITHSVSDRLLTFLLVSMVTGDAGYWSGRRSTSAEVTAGGATSAAPAAC